MLCYLSATLHCYK